MPNFPQEDDWTATGFVDVAVWDFNPFSVFRPRSLVPQKSFITSTFPLDKSPSFP
jgi:hypothetical protein